MSSKTCKTKKMVVVPLDTSDTINFEGFPDLDYNKPNFDPDVLQVHPELRIQVKEKSCQSNSNSLKSSTTNPLSKCLDKTAHDKTSKNKEKNLKNKVGNLDQLLEQNTLNLADILGHNNFYSNDTSQSTINDNQSEASYSLSVPAQVCDKVVKQIQQLGFQQWSSMRASEAMLKITGALEELQKSWEQDFLEPSSEKYVPPRNTHISNHVVTLLNKVDPFICTSTDCSVIQMGSDHLQNLLSSNTKNNNLTIVGTKPSSIAESVSNEKIQNKSSVLQNEENKTIPKNLKISSSPPSNKRLTKNTASRISIDYRETDVKDEDETSQIFMQDPITKNAFSRCSFQDGSSILDNQEPLPSRPFRCDQVETGHLDAFVDQVLLQTTKSNKTLIVQDKISCECVGTTNSILMSTGVNSESNKENIQLPEVTLKEDSSLEFESQLSLLDSKELEQFTFKSIKSLPPPVNSAVEQESSLYLARSGDSVCTVQKIDSPKLSLSLVQEIENMEKKDRQIDSFSCCSSMRATADSMASITDVRSGDELWTKSTASTITDFQCDESEMQIGPQIDDLYPFCQLPDINDKNFLDFLAQFNKQERKSKNLKITDETIEPILPVTLNDLEEKSGNCMAKIGTTTVKVQKSSSELSSLHLKDESRNCPSKGSSHLHPLPPENPSKIIKKKRRSKSSIGELLIFKRSSSHSKNEGPEVKKASKKTKDKKSKKINTKNNSTKESKNKLIDDKNGGMKTATTMESRRVKSSSHVVKEGQQINKLKSSLSTGGKSAINRLKTAQELAIANYVKQELAASLVFDSKQKLGPLRDILNKLRKVACSEIKFELSKNPSNLTKGSASKNPTPTSPSKKSIKVENNILQKKAKT